MLHKDTLVRTIFLKKIQLLFSLVLHNCQGGFNKIILNCEDFSPLRKMLALLGTLALYSLGTFEMSFQFFS